MELHILNKFFKKINRYFLLFTFSFFFLCGCESYISIDEGDSSDYSSPTDPPTDEDIPDSSSSNSDQKNVTEKPPATEGFSENLQTDLPENSPENSPSPKNPYPERAVYRVIHLNEKQGAFSSSGSGFFISEDLFVTALHVVEDLTDIEQIYFTKEESDYLYLDQVLKAEKLEAVSIYADIAIFRTQEKSPYFLKEGKISLDENLFFMGYPQGFFKHLQSESPSTKKPHTPVYFANFNLNNNYQGSSGGAILNSQGEFVGVNAKGNKNELGFFSSHYVQQMLNGEIGRRCEDVTCIEEENKMVQQHIEEYANNSQDTSLDSIQFFHLIIERLLELNDKDHVLNYLLKGALQEEDLFQEFYLTLRELEKRGVHDSDMTLSWIKEAGHRGLLSGQIYLSRVYSFGIGGVEKNSNEALYWFEKRAHQGDVNAQYYLGLSYIHGTDIVEKDWEKAFYWLNKVANQKTDTQLQQQSLNSITRLMTDNSLSHNL